MRNRLYAKDIVAGLELMCLLCQSIISVVFFFFPTIGVHIVVLD